MQTNLNPFIMLPKHSRLVPGEVFVMADNPNAPTEPALARRRTRENWGSRLGVILAVAGSAVGLGNFLRFPGLAATNGGGIFMIPYFTSLLILGIPICWVEWTIGRYGGARGFNSAPGVFTALWPNRFSKYVGALALIIPVGIYMYYVYVEAWCLAYAWDYVSGAMREYGASAGTDATADVAAYKAHFREFVGMSENGFLVRGSLQKSVVFLMIVFTINFILIYRGLIKGIEMFCKYAMPLLIICALIVLARVLTLGTPNPDQPEANVNNALGFMWNPKTGDKGFLEALANPELWLSASGQIFFSLSVGFGIVLNYASYLKADDDVVLSGLTATSTNEFCEVCLGGLITVPVAFLFLGEANLTKEVLGSTFSLGFMSLPAVFARMPAGNFFGAVWFFMLFIAAITSSLSMLQPAIAFFEEGFGMGRRLSVTCLGLLTAIGVLLVVYFSKNLLATDTLDFWIGTVCIFMLATVEVILVGWVFGISRAREEVKRGAAMQVPRVFWFIIKYVSPTYLLVIFGFWCYKNIPAKIDEIRAMSPEDRGTVLLMLAFIAVLLIFFGMLANLADKRWHLIGKLPLEPHRGFPLAAADVEGRTRS
ncbi:MAG: sodium-dependent transporter [Phycisphaerae bacterium]